ncbi:MAG: acyl-CoA/acyl-ACP dehydrogenase [Deltaproteobacteria bacterium]|nr:acyl-CoA/acyl-ACP dehydrogenase [Deltaproteobacteria bacterium]
MWENLLDTVGLAVRDEARAFVRDVPVELVRDMDADKIRFPREYVRGLGSRNLLGLRFPREVGGRGLPWTVEMAVLEEIGVLGTALGCAFAMPSIVGEALSRFGTPQQQERWLRPMLRGEKVAAEALTEPRGGSDFFGATTTARPHGGGFVLDGAKRFVVGAEGADFFLVYAKTDPKAPRHKSLGLFLVDRDAGVKVEHLYGLLGTRGGGTGRIVFKGVCVPHENLVGQLDQGGEIFNRMMVPERLTSAGGALGAARAALDIATRYSAKRKAFGKVIREFQAVSFRLAGAVARLDAARGLAYAACRAADGPADPRRLVSEAKKFCTETAWDAVNVAMQTMGGIGYTSVYPVERLLRDVRLMTIWTGTNDVMDLLIQHEWYREVLERAADSRDVERDVPPGGDDEKDFG